MRAAGHEIAGKDPLAVFLTQLSRSPVIRKGTRAGVYELDPTAPQRLRTRSPASSRSSARSRPRPATWPRCVPAGPS